MPTCLEMYDAWVQGNLQNLLI